MKTQFPEPHDRHGFTLVELLVVITIIIVLALVGLSAVSNSKKGANKARAITQMRDLGVGIALWAAEKNNNEPMYFRDGSGDSSSEATPPLTNTGLCAGNPAMLLYDRTNPDQAYVQNHAVFFSPIHKYTVPAREKYDPSKASASSLWGTYMWVYPSVPDAERSPRQVAAMRNSSFTAVGQAAYNNVLMFDDYSVAKALYPRTYYALFRDGAVRQVASNGDIWGWFKGTAK